MAGSLHEHNCLARFASRLRKPEAYATVDTELVAHASGLATGAKGSAQRVDFFHTFGGMRYFLN